jgi:phytoene desaturase
MSTSSASRRQHVVVIGSGFGALGAAIRLAARGHQVSLFEQRDKLGGRAYQYEIGGFRFDGGPTVITAPYMFEELYAEAGQRSTDHISLTPLDPFYRLFDHDGRAFDYRHRMEDMAAEVERWHAPDAEGYRRMAVAIRRIFDRFVPLTERPFLRLADMVGVMPDMVRLGAFLGTHAFVSRYIRDPFLRRVFSFHPLLIGGNPFTTPAVFTLIAQFEKEWGVHYAMGGTGAIVTALGRLLADVGGRVHLGTPVREIVIRNRTATGVRLEDGTVVPADAVVCNADVAFTYRTLIAPEHRGWYTNARIARLQPSMSLFVAYFGTKRRYRDAGLAHHNVILNERYRGLLRDVFRGTRVPDDFSLYLHAPSLTDPAMAPEGCESFYVLSPVPALGPGSPDWTTFAAEYKERIYEFLEAHYLPGLRANLVADHHIDPLHFRDTLSSHRGAAFGPAPTLLQTSYFRPHNRSEEFANLYFVGAGTHPGAGIPAVLASGKIAADLIAPRAVAAPVAGALARA